MATAPTHAAASATKTTKVKFTKTSCYYCNEWFEGAEIENHLTTCGQELAKCPNGCDTYVPRKEMDRHVNRCPAGFGEINAEQSRPPLPTSIPPSPSSMPPTTLTTITPLAQVCPEEPKIRDLEAEVLALRRALNQEILQRLSLITDIGQLKKRSQLGDEWTAKVGDVLNALKKCINEETESRCVDIERCKIDINGLLKQREQIESWRAELTTRFNQLQGEVKKEAASVTAIRPAPPPPTSPQPKPSPSHQEDKLREAKLMMMESRLNHLQSELENLMRQKQMQPQPQHNGTMASGDEAAVHGIRAAIEDMDAKLQTVDVVLEDHHNSIRQFQEETRRGFFDLRGEIDPMRMVVQEQLDKQAKLDYQLKGVLNTVNESEDSSDKIQKTLDKYRRETYYTKQCLDDLQVHLRHQDQLVVIQNTRGHLIWRIDQFDKRFKESQENELMIKSPLFADRPFGYTLRLEASLNGIGTWRGRNLIVGLVVVSGYYDNLLEWPCALTGTVTLRDQPASGKQPTNFSKTVLARRKHQHYDKHQYIHIPHQVLRSEHYIRDDAIFLEVRIDQ